MATNTFWYDASLSCIRIAKHFIHPRNKTHHPAAEQKFSSIGWTNLITKHLKKLFMHQNKKVLSIRRTKLFIQQLNKYFHPSAEQNSSCIKTKTFYQTAERNFLSIGWTKLIMHQNKNILSNSRTKLFIQQLNKNFHPTAEQNFSCIKISIIKRIRSFVNMDTYSQSIKT